MCVIVAQSCLTLGNPWTVACQAHLFMGFSRPKYWSGLPFPSPRDLPDSGIVPGSPALQADSLPSEPREKPEFSKTDLKMESQCSKRKTAQKLPPRRRKMTRLTAGTHASYRSRTQSPSGWTEGGTPTSPAPSITHPTKAAGMVCSWESLTAPSQ